MIHPYLDRIEAWPHRKHFQDYNRARLLADMQAGATVAVFAIPQAIAYAVLAGLPPAHGLYTAIVASFVAALWGSSQFVNTGPTNSSALLIATALAPLAAQPDFFAAVAAFTFMVGLFRMLSGVLRLGDIVHFVPDSVIIGFTTAIGIHIGLGQIHHLFGLPAPTSPYLPGRLYEVIAQLKQARWEPCALGLATWAFVRIGSKFKRIPTALLAMAIGALLVKLLGWSDIIRTAGDIGKITASLPGLSLPNVSPKIWIELLPAALAVAMIGLIESVSIGQRLAMKHHQHLNVNQEFFGQGLSQIVASFFQCIPGSGSFSRSVLVEQTGGRTVLANVFFSLFTLGFLLLIPHVLMAIPVPCLAGLLLYVAVGLMDPARIKRVQHTSREDTILLILTLTVTLFVKVEYGIFAGILMGNILFLRRTRTLHMPELVPYPDGHLEEHPYTPHSVHAKAPLVALTVYGELFYGVSKELRDQLMEVVKLQHPKIIVLRIRRVFSIDYACWNALFEFAEWYNKNGGALYISGVRPDVRQLILDADAADFLPENQVFPQTEKLMEAFHIAVAAALVNLPEDGASPVHWEAYLDSRKKNLRGANPLF